MGSAGSGAGVGKQPDVQPGRGGKGAGWREKKGVGERERDHFNTGMGNSLGCDAEGGGVGLLHTNGWNCSGVTRAVGGETCVFNGTYALWDGQGIEVPTCMSFGEVPPPFFNVMLEAPEKLGEFWCPTVQDISQRNFPDASNYATCECVPDESTSEVDEEKKSTWVLGVMFSIFSSVATTLGTILQKYAHMKNDARPPEKRAREIAGLLISGWWLLALFIMVLLPLPFDFVSFSMAPQSLLVPFAGMTIFLNSLMAPLILKETLDRTEVIATAVIIVGLVLATAFGPKEDANLNACQLLDRYDDIDFVMTVGTVLGMIAVLLYYIHVAPQTARVVRFRPAMYAFCAGGFGGVGNVFFKATGELAESGLADDGRSQGAWQTIHPYYHIVLIIIFAFLQISHINQGLRRYDAVMYLPLYNTFYILLSGTVGAIVYKEFANYDTTQWIFFPLGIATTLTGILIMSQKTPGQPSNAIVPRGGTTMDRPNKPVDPLHAANV